MRRIVIAAVVIVAAAGALYYALAVLPQQGFRAALDESLKQLPPGYAVTYKDASYAPASGIASLSGVTVHKAEPHPFDATIEQVELRKPSLELAAQWAQAAANPAALTPETAWPVAQSVLAKGVTVHFEPATVSFDAMHIDGLWFFPWPLFQPGVPSLAAVEATIATDAPARLDQLMPLLRLEAAVLAATAHDSLGIDNMRVTGRFPYGASRTPTDVDYSIRKMESGPYDRGTFSSVTSEDITMTAGTQGTGSVDRLDIAGIDLRKPLLQLLAGDTPTPEMLDGLAIGRIEYSGFAVVQPNLPKFSFGGLSVSKVAFTGAVPVSGEFALTGIRLNKKQMPAAQAIEAFDQLGVDTLTLSFGAAYRWDLDQKRISLDNAVVTVDELGAVNLSADVADVSPEQGLSSAQARLVHALLRYHDASLAERALRVAATQSHADPAEFRQKLITMVQQQAAALGDSPAISAGAAAITAFLAAPQSLMIELAPPSPVALRSLQGAATMPPADLIALLGVTVTANQ